MKNNIITEEMESQSKYGIPHKNARNWYWEDDKNNVGYLRSITEMEALDRIDEFFPDRGKLTWIHVDDYNELLLKEND